LTCADVITNACQQLVTSPALTGDERALLATLGLENFLAVMTVAWDDRQAARIDVRAERVDQATDAIRRQGLSVTRAQFDLAPTKASSSGAVRDAVSLPRGSRPGSRAVLYVTASGDIAAGVARAEAVGDRELLGAALGYPPCCVKFFLHCWQTNVSPATVTRERGSNAALLNPALHRIYGLKLIFHFVCSWDCTPSLTMARARLARLAVMAPSLAAAERHARGYLLGCDNPEGSPLWGLAHVRRWHAVGDAVVVDEVSAIESPMSRLVKPGTRLAIDGPHEYWLGATPVRGDHAYALLYR
jgi:hypothetical protein